MWSTEQSQINPAWPLWYQQMAQADWDKAKAVLMAAANKYFDRTGNKQRFDEMMLKVNEATRSECCTMARKVYELESMTACKRRERAQKKAERAERRELVLAQEQIDARERLIKRGLLNPWTQIAGVESLEA